METLRESPTESPAPTRRALSRCVADHDGFAAAWGRRPVLSTSAELGRGFDDLLDLDGVDELLARRGLRTPFLRLAQDGAVVPPGRYTRAAGPGAEIADQVDEAAVARLFAGGATIVLQALHRTWEPIVALATALREDLGHPVQVNAYVTPPASRGFAVHYDVHDVFVLQFAGEKRWVVHDPVLEAPLRSQPWTDRRDAVRHAAAEREPVLDVTLRPGDSLYLPRGYLHAAEALGAVSGHLTVGIHVVTRRALVDAVLGLVDDDPELRRALPLGTDLADPQALRSELAETVAVLARRLQAVAPEELAARLPGRVHGSARPEPLAPLRQAAAAAAVGPHTVVRRRDGLGPAAVEERGGSVVLRLADRVLDVGEADADAVATLLDGEAHAVHELPGDAAAAARAAGALLLEGVVVPDAR